MHRAHGQRSPGLPARPRPFQTLGWVAAPPPPHCQIQSSPSWWTFHIAPIHASTRTAAAAARIWQKAATAAGRRTMPPAAVGRDGEAGVLPSNLSHVPPSRRRPIGAYEKETSLTRRLLRTLRQRSWIECLAVSLPARVYASPTADDSVRRLLVWRTCMRPCTSARARSETG